MTEQDWYKEYEQFIKQFNTGSWPDNLAFFKAACEWRKQKCNRFLEDTFMRGYNKGYTDGIFKGSNDDRHSRTS